MSQPSFWCVANLGDVDPLNYGGKFVCVDRTGVYPPELVVIDAPGEDENADRLKYFITLEPLTAIKGADGSCIGLSDNPFHVETEAWFGDSETLKSISDSNDIAVGELISLFLSSDLSKRATAYIMALDCFGCHSFNEYPVSITVDKAKAVCDEFLRQIEETKNWHQGYYSLRQD